MKFTKKERNEIYKKALDIHLKLLPYRYAYLCNLFYSICETHQGSLSELPEFDLFDTGSDYVWFSKQNGYHGGYESQEVKEAQRMLLLFCIEMTN